MSDPTRSALWLFERQLRRLEHIRDAVACGESTRPGPRDVAGLLVAACVAVAGAVCFAALGAPRGMLGHVGAYALLAGGALVFYLFRRWSKLPATWLQLAHRRISQYCPLHVDAYWALCRGEKELPDRDANAVREWIAVERRVVLRAIDDARIAEAQKTEERARHVAAISKEKL